MGIGEAACAEAPLAPTKLCFTTRKRVRPRKADAGAAPDSEDANDHPARCLKNQHRRRVRFFH